MECPWGHKIRRLRFKWNTICLIREVTALQLQQGEGQSSCEGHTVVRMHRKSRCELWGMTHVPNVVIMMQSMWGFKLHVTSVWGVYRGIRGTQYTDRQALRSPEPQQRPPPPPQAQARSTAMERLFVNFTMHLMPDIETSGRFWAICNPNGKKFFKFWATDENTKNKRRMR